MIKTLYKFNLVRDQLVKSGLIDKLIYSDYKESELMFKSIQNNVKTALFRFRPKDFYGISFNLNIGLAVKDSVNSKYSSYNDFIGLCGAYVSDSLSWNYDNIFNQYYGDSTGNDPSYDLTWDGEFFTFWITQNVTGYTPTNIRVNYYLIMNTDGTVQIL